MVKAGMIGAGSAILLLLAGLLLGPRLIGQERLQGWILPTLRQALHRDVTVTGPITLRLLPSPEIRVEQVVIAEKGAILANLPLIEARISFASLLRLRPAPEMLRLERPEFSLASFALDAGPRQTGEASASPSRPPPVDSDGGHARLSGQFLIEQGRLILPGKAHLVIEPIDIRVRLADDGAHLNGHAALDGQGFEVKGDLDWSGDGAPHHEFTLKSDQGYEIGWSGIGLLAGAQPGLSGKFTARIDPRGAGGWTKQRLALTGDLRWGEAGAHADNLLLAVGDDDFHGSAAFTMGERPRLTLDLQGKRLSLDHSDVSPAPDAANTKDRPPAAAQSAPLALPSLELPNFGALSIAISLDIDQILTGGVILQDGRLDLALEQGALTVKQASLTLPGNSRISAEANLAAGAITGHFAGKSDDLRQTLAWAGLDLTQIPADRLHRATIDGVIGGDRQQINLDQVRLRLDSSQVDLSAGWRPGARPALDVHLSLDLLNLDAYWRQSAKRESAVPAGIASNGQSPSQSAAPSPGWDLTLDANAGRLIWHGAELKEVSLGLSASESLLSIDHLSVAEWAGARWQASGKVSDPWRDPTFAPLTLRLQSRDLAQSLRGFGVELPLAAPIDLTAQCTGPLAAPQIRLSAPSLDFGKTRLQLLQADLTLAGEHIALERISAQLFGGQLSGDLSATRNRGEAALHLKLTGAEIRQALLDIADIGLADGKLDAAIDLESLGQTASERKAHLSGTARFAVRDGRIKGFDLAAADRNLAGNQGVGGLLLLLQSGLTGGSTHFSSLSGTARAENGVIRSDDLALIADGGGATGAALIDLPNDNVEAHADFRFASAKDAPPLVMRLSGPLESPRRFIDIKNMQQWLADHGLKTGKPKDVLKSLLQGLVK